MDGRDFLAGNNRHTVQTSNIFGLMNTKIYKKNYLLIGSKTLFCILSLFNANQMKVDHGQMFLFFSIMYVSYYRLSLSLPHSRNSFLENYWKQNIIVNKKKLIRATSICPSIISWNNIRSNKKI